MGVKYSKPLDPKVSKSSTETPNFYCIIYMGLDMEQRDTTIINKKIKEDNVDEWIIFVRKPLNMIKTTTTKNTTTTKKTKKQKSLQRGVTIWNKSLLMSPTLNLKRRNFTNPSTN